MSDLCIRLRACLAAVDNGRILLVPHYDTDAGPVQWLVPGGRVEFGERLEEAALREFREETGLHARLAGLLDVSEVVIPERPYHSVAVVFQGVVVGGRLRAEADACHGTKPPRWFAWPELRDLPYHPERAVRLALGVQPRPPS